MNTTRDTQRLLILRHTRDSRTRAVPESFPPFSGPGLFVCLSVFLCADVSCKQSRVISIHCFRLESSFTSFHYEIG
jgi:hypothetical protein